MNEYVKVTPQMLGGEWQQNRFWRLRVQGGLSQRHADFHNAIVMPATESHVHGDGRLCLSVDPAAVGRAMPCRQYTHEQLDVLLREIMQALAKWKSCRRIGLSGTESIFNSFEEVPQATHDPATGESHLLWHLTFGEAWTALISTNIAVRTGFLDNQISGWNGLMRKHRSDGGQP